MLVCRDRLHADLHKLKKSDAYSFTVKYELGYLGAYNIIFVCILYPSSFLDYSSRGFSCVKTKYPTHKDRAWLVLKTLRRQRKLLA